MLVIAWYRNTKSIHCMLHEIGILLAMSVLKCRMVHMIDGIADGAMLYMFA